LIQQHSTVSAPQFIAIVGISLIPAIPEIPVDYRSGGLFHSFPAGGSADRSARDVRGRVGHGPQGRHLVETLEQE
jgi:hypothetical protein